MWLARAHLMTGDPAGASEVLDAAAAVGLSARPGRRLRFCATGSPSCARPSPTTLGHAFGEAVAAAGELLTRPPPVDVLYTRGLALTGVGADRGSGTEPPRRPKRSPQPGRSPTAAGVVAEVTAALFDCSPGTIPAGILTGVREALVGQEIAEPATARPPARGPGPSNSCGPRRRAG